MGKALSRITPLARSSSDAWLLLDLNQTCIASYCIAVSAGSEVHIGPYAKVDVDVELQPKAFAAMTWWDRAMALDAVMCLGEYKEVVGGPVPLIPTIRSDFEDAIETLSDFHESGGQANQIDGVLRDKGTYWQAVRFTPSFYAATQDCVAWTEENSQELSARSVFLEDMFEDQPEGFLCAFMDDLRTVWEEVTSDDWTGATTQPGIRADGPTGLFPEYSWWTWSDATTVAPVALSLLQRYRTDPDYPALKSFIEWAPHARDGVCNLKTRHLTAEGERRLDLLDHILAEARNQC